MRVALRASVGTGLFGLVLTAVSAAEPPPATRSEAATLAHAVSLVQTQPEAALAMLTPAPGSLLECESRLTRAELFGGAGRGAEALAELESLPATGCSDGLRTAALALGTSLATKSGDKKSELAWLTRWLELRARIYRPMVDAAADGKTSLQIQKALNRDGKELSAGWRRVADLRALSGDLDGSRGALRELYLFYPQTEPGSKVDPKSIELEAADADLFARARILAAVGRLDAAISALQPLSAKATDPAILEKTLLQLGELNERLRDGPASAAALDRVLKRASPSSVTSQRARFLLSRTLYRRLPKRGGETLPLLESLDNDATDPTVRASALQFRVGVLQEMNRDGEAMKLLTAEGARKGSSIRDYALEKLGWIRYSRSDWGGAVKAYAELLALPATGELRAAGYYWGGRAHEHLGQPAHAQKLYGELAAEFPFHWYGLAGSARLAKTEKKSGALLPEVQAPPLVARYQAAKLPPKRASKIEALLQSKLNRFAIWELESALAEEPENLRTAFLLSDLHASEGDFEESVLLANRAFGSVRFAGLQRAPRELLRLLYPLAYSKDLKRFADAQSIPAPLVAALIHQESGFFHHVVSAAGAVGLMQLMPGTGANLARQLGMKDYEDKKLEEPAVNLRLGTYFLGGLIRRFGAHLPPAVASYNAGPERARKWWTTKNAADVPLWVERIPYSETRDYVKKVLGKAEAYRRLYPELSTPAR